MILTMLGLLFVTTSAFKYAGTVRFATHLGLFVCLLQLPLLSRQTSRKRAVAAEYLSSSTLQT